jgi:spore coat polysaccharide biosynthesis predicted glycosyltransferase SpsG
MLAEAIAGLMHDQPARAALARTIGAMVDGRGARRVCGALT